MENFFGPVTVKTSDTGKHKEPATGKGKGGPANKKGKSGVGGKK